MSESATDVPDGGTPAEAIALIDRHQADGRVNANVARRAVAFAAAGAAAAQLAADIKLAIDHAAVCWREPPPHAVGGDWRPFADLLAAAPEDTP